MPPVFTRMAGHPLRWRLLRELAHGDRRVRELAKLIGEPQSLVSYHLGRLRSSGLVAARRSTFDGRDSYYRLDLARCAELLAAAGAALHPALDPGLRPDPVALSPAGEATGKPSGLGAVLFLCTGNSARSQAAEALARVRSGGRVQAFSAGSHPRPLHQDAVRVMASHGVDLVGQRSKHLGVFVRRRFTHVITLCDRVREVCPEFPGDPAYVHWSIPDPVAVLGGDGDAHPAFELMAAELETRIGFWLASIGAAPTRSSTQDPQEVS